MQVITALMNAKTQSEVLSIEKKYKEILPKIQHYNLMRWVNNASIRIANVEREKKLSFGNLLN
jgi:hypothetical protein